MAFIIQSGFAPAESSSHVPACRLWWSAAPSACAARVPPGVVGRRPRRSPPAPTKRGAPVMAESGGRPCRRGGGGGPGGAHPTGGGGGGGGEGGRKHVTVGSRLEWRCRRPWANRRRCPSDRRRAGDGPSATHREAQSSRSPSIPKGRMACAVELARTEWGHQSHDITSHAPHVAPTLWHKVPPHPPPVDRTAIRPSRWNASETLPLPTRFPLDASTRSLCALVSSTTIQPHRPVSHSAPPQRGSLDAVRIERRVDFLRGCPAAGST